jgi:hypothetical protein
MAREDINLPDLIELNNHGGHYATFIDAVYAVFENDFVKSTPKFRGQRLSLKKYPIVGGREYTFYHMTHKGEIEADREPDLRRCERIGWAKPVIEKTDDWKLKIWPQQRNGKNRLCIWVEKQNEPDYFVILDVRANYILPWTTFVAEYPNQKRKKEKEYLEYIKSKKQA